MDRMFRVKLNNMLRAEARQTLEDKMETKEKIGKMNDIFNLKLIIDNYDELEPTLKKYFIEKHEKEKFEIDK